MLMTGSFNLGLDDVISARSRISQHVRITPLEKNDYLSSRVKATVFTKNENMQITGSFKIRGALNKMMATPIEELKAGVVTASAGNHAQGVAYAARLLGVPCTVYMPMTTPYIKVQATESYGASVRLVGTGFEDAYGEALEFASKTGLLMIHPFDDPLVAAGQGTLALEVRDILADFDMIIVPVGGGGLISGVCAALSDLKPNVKVVGVQAEGASSVSKSFYMKKLVKAQQATTFAEGIATKTTTDRVLEYIEDKVDQFVTVSDDEIALAVLTFIERSKLLAEGAGAASLAAVLGGKLDLEGKRVVCVVSGGNMDMMTLSRVVDRGLVIEGRRLKLSVRLPDRPGELSRLLQVVAMVGANILSIEHDREALDISVGLANVELEVEVSGPDHSQQLINSLSSAGFAATLV